MESCASSARQKVGAMNLLIRRDRTEKELRDKLRTAGYPDAATIEAVCEYVKSYGYINDDRGMPVHYLEIGAGERKVLRNLVIENLLQKGSQPEKIIAGEENIWNCLIPVGRGYSPL
jgi:regulatory protein